MKLSKAGEDLMHKYEGFRSRPYLCPAHIWTIGYGHVLYQEQIRLPVVRVEGKETPMIRKEMPLKPEDNRVWTKTEIDELFRTDVGTFERGVLRLVPGVVGRQGAFDALVSISFNFGLATSSAAPSACVPTGVIGKAQPRHSVFGPRVAVKSCRDSYVAGKPRLRCS